MTSSPPAASKLRPASCRACCPWSCCTCCCTCCLDCCCCCRRCWATCAGFRMRAEKMSNWGCCCACCARCAGGGRAGERCCCACCGGRCCPICWGCSLAAAGLVMLTCPSPSGLVVRSTTAACCGRSLAAADLLACPSCCGRSPLVAAGLLKSPSNCCGPRCTAAGLLMLTCPPPCSGPCARSRVCGCALAAAGLLTCSSPCSGLCVRSMVEGEASPAARMNCSSKDSSATGGLAPPLGPAPATAAAANPMPVTAEGAATGQVGCLACLADGSECGGRAAGCDTIWKGESGWLAPKRLSTPSTRSEGAPLCGGGGWSPSCMCTSPASPTTCASPCVSRASPCASSHCCCCVRSTSHCCCVRSSSSHSSAPHSPQGSMVSGIMSRGGSVSSNGWAAPVRVLLNCCWPAPSNSCWAVGLRGSTNCC